MLIPVLSDIIVYASILVMLAISFNLTSRTINAPNFSTGAVMVTGILSSIFARRIVGFLYLGLPMGIISGAITSFLTYELVLKYLVKWKRSPVHISLASLGLQLALMSGFQIYAIKNTNWVHYGYSTTPGYYSIEYDFILGPTRGVFYVSGILSVIIFVITLLQNRTRFGLSLSMIKEQTELAQIQGINVHRLNSWIWIIAGGLAGLAGSLKPIAFSSPIGNGYTMMPPIITVALVGGMMDIRGCFVGAISVAILEIGGIYLAKKIVGEWVVEFQSLIPIILIAFLLLCFPNGLKGNHSRTSKLEEF